MKIPTTCSRSPLKSEVLERNLTLNDTTKLKNLVREDKSMNGTEKVVEHLKMTQAVINRLGSNSFLVKSWSMTIIVAAMV